MKSVQENSKILLLRICAGAVSMFLFIILWYTGTAQAITINNTYIFYAITNNKTEIASYGELQLRMDVSGGTEIGDHDYNKVSFTFYHEGSNQMSITDIYFYDGVLGINGTNVTSFEGIPEWDAQQKRGVAFSLGATPSELPGANFFLTSASVVYSCDSDSPVAKTGVDPGEKLKITFSLAEGMNITHVIEALQGWIKDKEFHQSDLVVGLHVQAFEDDGSVSFLVAGPAGHTTPVPSPSSLLLFSGGLGALVLFARKRRWSLW